MVIVSAERTPSLGLHIPLPHKSCSIKVIFFFLFRGDFMCGSPLPALNLAAFYMLAKPWGITRCWVLFIQWVTVDIGTDISQHILCNCHADTNVTWVASVVIPFLYTATCCQELPVQKETIPSPIRALIKSALN